MTLWTDKERQWESLTPRLRAALPHFLTLGSYIPGERTGPAIWVKCMIERALLEANWSADAVPVFYLPGVSRHELRAVEECPRDLQPLAELSGSAGKRQTIDIGAHLSQRLGTYCRGLQPWEHGGIEP